MAEQIRTLVVDDEPALRFFIEETLLRTGHEVVGVGSGEEALERLRNTSFDLIVLDLMLGGRMDGLGVLQAVRWRWPDTVVVILTAHGSLESAMEAIRQGIDGYLLKPVEPTELRQAVQEAMDRRRGPTRALDEEDTGPAHILRRGPFCVDLRKHTASRDGQPLDLTPSEFDLLAHLIQNADRAISPQELVWVAKGYHSEDVQEAREIVKWYIYRLRRKVEPEAADPRYVLNVRGVGYRFGS